MIPPVYLVHEVMEHGRCQVWRASEKAADPGLGREVLVLLGKRLAVCRQQRPDERVGPITELDLLNHDCPQQVRAAVESKSR